MTFSRVKLLVAYVVLIVSAPSQSQSPTSSSATVLKATARIVVVDVTVQDKSHHAVHGLRSDDFQLVEDKVPQRLLSFEEHSSAGPEKAKQQPAAPKLPSGMYTNYIAAPASSPINVLLIDALNTPQRDQSTLREQLLAFVRSQRPGYQVAVFSLTDELTMLQGVSADPAVLEATLLKRGGPKQGSTFNDSLRGSGDTVINEQINNSASDPVLGAAVARLGNFDKTIETQRTEVRARQTLDALNALARYLSALPGRKNLIWFSGSFPVNPSPSAGISQTNVTASQTSSASYFGSFAADEAEFKETINLFARAQIAVYPIDARGIFNVSGVNGTDASNANGQYAIRSNVPSVGASSSESLSSTGIGSPGLMGSDLANNSADIANDHAMMSNIAEGTGGRAYFNANSLAKFTADAIASGSDYYTLTYVPSNGNWNGLYRKIHLETEGKSYVLSYRRGYYADSPDSPNDKKESAVISAGHFNPIVAAMLHGAPPSTQILMTTRFQPSIAGTESVVAAENTPEEPARFRASGPFHRYTATYIADLNGIEVVDTHKGKLHFNVEFVAFVLDSSGKRVNSVTTHLVADVTPQNLDLLRQKGVAIQQQISVPAKGQFFLRVAIHDLSNNHIGSVELPAAELVSLPMAKATPAAQR